MLSVNSVFSPKCKISNILEPDGVNNLGEKEERKDPKGRKCHGEDGLGVAPHCVSSETEDEIRERGTLSVSYQVTSAGSQPGR